MLLQITPHPNRLQHDVLGRVVVAVVAGILVDVFVPGRVGSVVVMPAVLGIGTNVAGAIR